MGVADSLWVSVTNWSTPTILFCILNIMIVTIFISSSFQPHKGHKNHEHGSEGPSSTSPQLFRAPSLLERVKSLNFSFHRSDQPDPFPPVPSHEDQEEHKAAEENQEVHSESHHMLRSQSETSVKVPKNGAATRKMKKSASEKIVALEKEKEEEAEVVDQRRPATVRERTGKWSQTHEDDEAVDEKADDFINRFKQQLKLQRLESILRYKEMLNRGAGR